MIIGKGIENLLGGKLTLKITSQGSNDASGWIVGGYLVVNGAIVKDVTEIDVKPDTIIEVWSKAGTSSGQISSVSTYFNGTFIGSNTYYYSYKKAYEFTLQSNTTVELVNVDARFDHSSKIINITEE